MVRERATAFFFVYFFAANKPGFHTLSPLDDVDLNKKGGHRGVRPPGIVFLRRNQLSPGGCCGGCCESGPGGPPGGPPPFGGR